MIESLEKRGSGSREDRLTWLRQWESPLGPPVGTAPSLGCAWLDGPDPPGGRREKAPDMSVAMSVELGTSTAVDFDERSREIQDTAAAMLELGDPMAGASAFRNPSHVAKPYGINIAAITFSLIAVTYMAVQCDFHTIAHIQGLNCVITSVGSI